MTRALALALCLAFPFALGACNGNGSGIVDALVEAVEEDLVQEVVEDLTGEDDETPAAPDAPAAPAAPDAPTTTPPVTVKIGQFQISSTHLESTDYVERYGRCSSRETGRRMPVVKIFRPGAPSAALNEDGSIDIDHGDIVRSKVVCSGGNQCTSSATQVDRD